MTPRRIMDAQPGDKLLRRDGSLIGTVAPADGGVLRVRLVGIGRVWTWHHERLRIDATTLPGMRSLDSVLIDHGLPPAGYGLELVAG